MYVSIVEHLWEFGALDVAVSESAQGIHFSQKNPSDLRSQVNLTENPCGDWGENVIFYDFYPSGATGHLLQPN